MTRYIASLSIDLDRNTNRTGAYRLSIEPEEAPGAWSRETGKLFQIGQVWNNHLTYRGCFSSRDEALREVMGYLDIPCVIRESEEGRISIMPHAIKSHDRVIAARSAKGTFIAAEPHG